MLVTNVVAGAGGVGCKKPDRRRGIGPHAKNESRSVQSASRRVVHVGPIGVLSTSADRCCSVLRCCEQTVCSHPQYAGNIRAQEAETGYPLLPNLLSRRETQSQDSPQDNRSD